MINEVILVGKVTKKPEKDIRGRVNDRICMEVIRHFQNSNGTYDSDHVEIQLWRGKALTLYDTCDIGSILAVKGRIQAATSAEEDVAISIIAEKITILDPYISQQISR